MLDQNNAKSYVAILDIGSNAVRLVIYDGLNRVPFKIHNERRVCSLGKDLGVTGRLHPEGVTKAIDAIGRFSGLLRAMKIKNIYAVATAALRDAEDGAAFIKRVHDAFGLEIRVIDGEEEARLSACGVMMNGLGGGGKNSMGLIGDYGGGSLELIGVERGQVKYKASAPIGSHRLQAAKTPEARLKLIDEALASIPFLEKFKGATFYALGGAWRSMAKAHMRLSAHPLPVLDHYDIDGTRAHDYASLIARQSPASLEKTEGMSKKRVLDMGVAALTMERLFETLSPQKLVFSGTGLREGLIYDALPPRVRQQDALIAGCRKIAQKISRFDNLRGFGQLARWMEPLFSNADAEFLRWLEAACLLSDTGWFEHEDVQAAHAYHRIASLPYYGLGHEGRAFLALAQYARYREVGDGNVFAKNDGDIAQAVQKLLSQERINEAIVAGLAMRLGYLLTGGALDLLKHSTLKITPKYLMLQLESQARLLHAETVDEAITSLALMLGCQGKVVIAD